MAFYTSPFFWALVSMLGMQAAGLIVSGHRLGRSLWFAFTTLALVTAGRVLLVLPFCVQPRLELGPWNAVLGGLVLAGAILFVWPALSIAWWRAPRAGMRLRTDGAYGIVRHPIYLCEVLWPIGWSLLWGSLYGLALTPLWWLAFLLHALVEEEALERELGGAYAAYRREVRGRILPGLPL